MQVKGQAGTVASWDAEVLAKWKIAGVNSCVRALTTVHSLRFKLWLCKDIESQNLCNSLLLHMWYFRWPYANHSLVNVALCSKEIVSMSQSRSFLLEYLHRRVVQSLWYYVCETPRGCQAVSFPTNSQTGLPGKVPPQGLERGCLATTMTYRYLHSKLKEASGYFPQETTRGENWGNAYTRIPPNESVIRFPTVRSVHA